MINKKPYLETIVEISHHYLKETFSNDGRLEDFLQKIDFLKESGLIRFDGTKISLTLKGMMLEEEVILN